jgi:hypothetical protein
MRHTILALPLVAAALVTSLPASAMTVPGLNPGLKATSDLKIDVASRRYGTTRGRDCTPTNGPYGYYGNLWCQPANESSYMRNLGASWPMNTPYSMRQQKRSGGSDW